MKGYGRRGAGCIKKRMKKELTITLNHVKSIFLCLQGEVTDGGIAGRHYNVGQICQGRESLYICWGIDEDYWMCPLWLIVI